MNAPPPSTDSGADSTTKNGLAIEIGNQGPYSTRRKGPEANKYRPSGNYGRRPLDRVQTHAGHSIAFNSMFAFCDPVTLTF